ncbi:extracellular sulfatase Sulf-1 isoform 8-T9 [Syngnathus typhle]
MEAALSHTGDSSTESAQRGDPSFPSWHSGTDDRVKLPNLTEEDVNWQGLEDLYSINESLYDWRPDYSPGADDWADFRKDVDRLFRPPVFLNQSRPTLDDELGSGGAGSGEEAGDVWFRGDLPRVITLSPPPSLENKPHPVVNHLPERNAVQPQGDAVPTSILLPTPEPDPVTDEPSKRQRERETGQPPRRVTPGGGGIPGPSSTPASSPPKKQDPLQTDSLQVPRSWPQVVTPTPSSAPTLEKKADPVAKRQRGGRPQGPVRQLEELDGDVFSGEGPTELHTRHDAILPAHNARELHPTHVDATHPGTINDEGDIFQDQGFLPLRPNVRSGTPGSPRDRGAAVPPLALVLEGSGSLPQPSDPQL